MARGRKEGSEREEEREERAHCPRKVRHMMLRKTKRKEPLYTYRHRGM